MYKNYEPEYVRQFYDLFKILEENQIDFYETQCVRLSHKRQHRLRERFVNVKSPTLKPNIIDQIDIDDEYIFNAGNATLKPRFRYHTQGDVQPTTSATTEFVVKDLDVGDVNAQEYADPDYYIGNTEDKFAEIKSYLAKPYRFNTTAWPAASVVNTTLWSTTDSWTIPSAVDAWIQKLKGFQGLRATLCLRAVLNTTPYSAGRLRLAYYPCGDEVQRKATVHVSHQIPFSQLPGVNLDANEGSVVLKIPYIAPTQYYQLTENSVSWGSIYLKVVAPYRTGADNAQSTNVTLWAWLEDVQLFGQTHNSIVTQSAGLASESESRPISSFFGGVSQVLGSLTAIPSLKPYLGAPIWVSNALRQTAFSLGWSKPNKAMLYQRNAIGSLQNMANCSGERVGNSFALNDDAKLMPIDSMSINHCDEMSVNYIKSVWSLFTTFTISTSNVAGDLLFENYTQPDGYKTTVSANEIYMTSLTYLSNWFEMYRGGIEFEIVLCKTAFHRGQIQITYQPGPSISADLAVSTYLYREVIDFEGNNKIKFVVPYINAWEYLPIDINSGRLQIRMVNPLQAPETVATTIDCLVYVRGHESLQFNRVTEHGYQPYVTQSAEMATSDILDLGFIGSSVNTTFSVLSPARCASELVNSLLQIGKRHWRMSTSSLALINANFWLNPFITTVISATSPVGENINGNSMSVLAAPFAFYRGSMEILVSESTVGAYTQKAAYDSLGTYATSTLLYPEGTHAITFANNINGGLLLECPYYNTARASIIDFATTIYQGTRFDTPRGAIVFPFNQTTTTITQALGDDFQYMFYVGVPRLANGS